MTWLDEARAVLDHFRLPDQQDAVAEAGRICADVIASDHLVHLFGCGHSRFAVDEMFPRYGAFPGFVPIIEQSLTTYSNVSGPNGLRQVMHLERTPGLGRLIAECADIRRGDAVIVFSVSGSNPVPVELATQAQRRNVPVIAVTNRRSVPPGGPTTSEGASVVVDLGVPPWDAGVDVEGWEVPIAPLSSVAYAAAVNLIRIRTAELLAERGIALPVITHAARVGSEESFRSIDSACAEHDRRVRRGPSR